MKRGVVAGVVVVHVAVIAGIFFLQGCGTMQPPPKPVQPVQPRQALSEPVLPPGEQKQAPMPAVVPLPKPPSKVEVKPALPPPPTIHVVAKGENLTLIAKRYGVKPSELAALNRIGNASSLREGQELVVPLAEAQAPAGTSGTAGAQPAGAAGEVIYTVVKGDSLSRIASRHGTTVAAIKQHNGLKSDVVRLGQKLKIPAAQPAERPASAGPADKAPAPAAAKPAAEQPAAQKAPAAKPAQTRPSPPVAKPAIDLNAKPVAAPAADAGRAGAADGIPLLIHEVQPNEDLVRIAMMYGVSVDAVKKANGMTSETVRPGQRLKIP
jgi:peptidoglycan endopeptidase LytE